MVYPSIHEITVDGTTQSVLPGHIGVYPRRHTRPGHEKRMKRITECKNAERKMQLKQSRKS